MEASLQQRQDAAQKYRQTALQQNVSEAEIQRLTQVIMSGQRDADVLVYHQRNPDQKPPAPAPSPFEQAPPISAATSFGSPMPFPTLQPMQMPGFPQMSMGMSQMSMGHMSMGPMSMPQSQTPQQPQITQNAIDQMFMQQIASPQTPEQSVPRMPGIPMMQMVQQGNANLHYSRSSSNPQGSSHFQMSHTSSQPTPMVQNPWPASASLPCQPPAQAYIQPPPQQPQAAITYQQPFSIPPYQAPQLFSPPAPQAPPPPQVSNVYQAPPATQVPVMVQPQQAPVAVPERPPYHFHAHATAPEPQNGRIPDAFQQQQRVVEEETYFGSPPGARDDAVQGP